MSSDEIRFTKRQADGSESQPLQSGSSHIPPAPPAEPTPPEHSPEAPPQPHRFARRTLLAVAMLQIPLVWFTMGGLGMTWDEAYYFGPCESSVQWFTDWISGNIDPAAGHDPYWEETWELPAIPRFVHGLSGRIFDGTWFADRNFFSPIVAQRLLSGVAHGLNCWLIAVLVFPLGGFLPALGALVAYASMPRVFGHAHLATTETLMVTMMLLIAWSSLRAIRPGREGWIWSVVVGVLFGLALNTKFNMVLLPLSLVPWALFHHGRRALPPLLAAVVLAPVVWFITWPWLWTDTVVKVREYFDHFLAHQQTAVWFHGQRWGYGALNAPWYYPLEMIAVTTPVATLLCGALGLVICARPRSEDRRESLFLFLALVPVAVSSLPGAPRYDGVRLFFPFFPAMALAVGVFLARGLAPPFTKSRVQRLTGAWLLIVLLGAPGAFWIGFFHPCELSFYNEAVGGVAGGEHRGYEIAAWCESINEPVIEHLNTLPEGATVRPLAIHDRIFDHYKAWGLLRGDIDFISPQGPTDYHIIQGRRGFFGFAETLLWERWSPRETRRFGWPRWEPIPRVVMVVVTETGEEFHRFLIQERMRAQSEQ